MEEIVKRKKAVTRLLVLLAVVLAVISAYLLYASNYAIYAFATEEKSQLFFFVQHNMVSLFNTSVLIMGILYALSCIGIIVLLKWKVWGFWLVVGSSLLTIIIDSILIYNGGRTGEGLIFLVAGIIIPIVLWALLQIKNESLSCWEQLK